jgi:endonuclease YncB( thermonuclease family)
VADFPFEHYRCIMPAMGILSAIIVLVYIVAAPAMAHAHSGGLDASGCHNDRKAGSYHCHRGKYAGRHYNSKSEALRLQRGEIETLRPKAARPTNAVQLTGIPRIVDGDTIRIGDTRIRLHGIDAPEAKQTCTAGGKEWRCGFEATSALASLIGAHWVSCSQRDVDRYGRIVAVCRAGPIELNAWMVGNGWAVAYRQYSMEYVRDEDDAKRARHGLWRGQFAMPWDWRREKRNGR